MPGVGFLNGLKLSHPLLLTTSIGVLIARGWIVLSLISSLTFGLLTNNMTERQKREQVQQTLDYMIAEGMVVRVKGGYRLKTEKELEQEMDTLYND